MKRNRQGGDGQTHQTWKSRERRRLDRWDERRMASRFARVRRRQFRERMAAVEAAEGEWPLA